MHRTWTVRKPSKVTVKSRIHARVLALWSLHMLHASSNISHQFFCDNCLNIVRSYWTISSSCFLDLKFGHFLTNVLGTPSVTEIRDACFHKRKETLKTFTELTHAEFSYARRAGCIRLSLESPTDGHFFIFF